MKLLVVLLVAGVMVAEWNVVKVKFTLRYACFENSCECYKICNEESVLFWQIEGFNKTSYQANFASHHTRDSHVGFLLALQGIGKQNKMFHNFYTTIQIIRE